MVNHSATLDATFFALSGRPRRELLRLTREQPMRLKDLSGELRLSLPALNKHVAVLERAGLVVKRKIGRERFVSANPEALQSVEEWISENTNYWNTQLDSLEELIKSLKEKP